MAKQVRPVLQVLREEIVTEGFTGGGSDAFRVLHGEPYAGKLHVRFDEGAGVPHGGAPLYSTPFRAPWGLAPWKSQKPLKI